MFRLDRLLRFAGKVMWAVVPSLVVVLVLSFLTQILAWGQALPEALKTWKFWLRVALGVVPLLLAIGTAFMLAARFLKAVYPKLSRGEAIKFIIYSRFGRPSFGPWIKVQGGRITANEDSVLTRIGGPGSLIIGGDNAVVLERAGVFMAVEGPGFPSLRPFEKIYDIVDLGPKSYSYTVSAMSREGIFLDWEVEVQYQIADGGQPLKDGAFYPLSQEDVFLASTSKWIREPSWKFEQDMDWEGLILVSCTEGKLRSILARRPLDQLIGLTEREDEAARIAIQNELEKELQDYAPKIGAKILRVRLDNLKVRDDVAKQWIETWKAEWQSWSAERRAHGDAANIFQFEKVKAEAQAEMILEISRALRIGLENRSLPRQAIPQMLLLRLFSVLDRADFAASSRIFFPTETMKALKSIREPVQGGPEYVVTALIASPSRIVAGGSTTVMATLGDGAGNSVPDGTEVVFDASGGGVLSSPMVASANSVAQTTLTASKKAGKIQVGARVAGHSASMTVRVLPGQPADVRLRVNPTSIEVGGKVELLVEARDAFGNSVADETPVLFHAPFSHLSPISADTNHGRAQSRLTAASKVGLEQISVEVGEETATGHITILPGPPRRLTLVPDSISVEAGQEAEIVATVVDQWDNPVADGTMVTFQPSRGSASPALAGTVGGRAATHLPAGLAPGPVEVSAAAGQAKDSISLQVLPGPPQKVVLICSADSTRPNGQVALSALLEDAWGNAAGDGIPVIFEAHPGQTDPPLAHTNDGVAHSRFMAGPLRGAVTVAVRAGSLSASRTVRVQ